MKLIEIWNAQEALTEVKKLKLPIKVSYSLMKHMKTVQSELEICEAERVRLVYEAAGQEIGSAVDLKPESPEYDVFIKAFSEYLQQDSSISPFPYNMDEFVDHLSVGSNSLSEDTLLRLEPLMRAPEAD